jgi:hypothetical protein
MEDGRRRERRGRRTEMENTQPEQAFENRNRPYLKEHTWPRRRAF